MIWAISILGYLYDAATSPQARLTTLTYPGTAGAPTLNTIAHSTFGNQVVGNYDTQLQTGNAFVYDIKTGTHRTNDAPGAVSTTAYGVWATKIAGGYAQLGPGGGPGFERGYIFDQATGMWTSYNHPGALVTHSRVLPAPVGRGNTIWWPTGWIRQETCAPRCFTSTLPVMKTGSTSPFPARA